MGLEWCNAIIVFPQAQAERLLIEGESEIEGKLSSLIFKGLVKFDFKCTIVHSLQACYLFIFVDFVVLVAKLKAEAAEVELVAELESTEQVSCKTSYHG